MMAGRKVEFTPTTQTAVADELRIVPIAEAPRAGVLAVLDQTFGPGHDEGWLAWKHLDNPFGPSPGWAAMDAEGVAGVRLFMRWELLAGGRTVRAVRPVDTATAPRARRRGLFRRLTEQAIKAVCEDPEIDLIFNTPNEKSRPGYARMGWTILPPLAHAIFPLWPMGAARVEVSEAAFDAFDEFESRAEAGGRLRTRRDAAVMRWRYGAGSGLDYCAARLAEADAANAIVYRVVRRSGLRLLLVSELMGGRRERARLVRGVARREGAAAALLPVGAGALEGMKGVRLRRGASVLAVRPLRELSPDPLRLDAWACSLGDLERVI